MTRYGVREKHHWFTSNKWGSVNDKMMFERNIIIKHQISDDQIIIKLC